MNEERRGGKRKAMAPAMTKGMGMKMAAFQGEKGAC